MSVLVGDVTDGPLWFCFFEVAVPCPLVAAPGAPVFVPGVVTAVSEEAEVEAGTWPVVVGTLVFARLPPTPPLPPQEVKTKEIASRAAMIMNGLLITFRQTPFENL